VLSDAGAVIAREVPDAGSRLV